MKAAIANLLILIENYQFARHRLAKLSLVVFEENVGARKLYERLGYREVARATIVPHALIHYSGDALLMVKSIPPGK